MNNSLIVPRGIMRCNDWEYPSIKLYQSISPAVVLDGISSRVVRDVEMLEKWVNVFVLKYITRGEIKKPSVRWWSVGLPFTHMTETVLVDDDLMAYRGFNIISYSSFPGNIESKTSFVIFTEKHINE